MIQDHLLQPGRMMTVRPLAGLPRIGTLRIEKIENGVVHGIYVPDEGSHGRSTEVKYSRGDAVWMISRGIWYDPDDMTTMPRLSDDQVDDFLSDRHCEEIFENVIELNTIWTKKFDEHHLLEILHRRLDLVWDRANTHRAQDLLSKIEKKNKS